MINDKKIEYTGQDIQEQYRKVLQDYHTMKQQYEDAKNRIAVLEDREKEIVTILSENILQEQEYQSAMKKAKNCIQKQRKEIQIYKSELEKYRRIMNKVNNTWYGKLALKVYRVLVRLKFFG